MYKKMIIPILCTTFILFGCNDKDITIEEKNDKSEENIEEAVETSGSVDEIVLPDEDLQKGDENEAVKQLQQALIEIGYPIEDTGVYDELTTWAMTDIQLQQEALTASGVYDSTVKKILEEILAEDIDIDIGLGLNKPRQPNIFTEIIENPYDILVLVNKNYALPNDFEPDDLIVPDVPFPFTEDDPKKQLRQEAALALEQLFNGAEKAGLHLFAQSGYRSYDRQEAIFAANVAKHGEAHANTFSARAGESEHQTGLVMDVTSQEVGFDLITEFGETKEGIWLANHAHEYGFIIRYPEGKEHITKYQYEPWHLRYVGIKAATEIKAANLTLEEYLGAE